MAQLISPLDAAFLYMESHETPMHVAALQIFNLPPNAPEDYLKKLVVYLRDDKDLSSPWNKKLKLSVLAKLLPSWQIDRDVDLEYHVRHLALPKPGGERELGVLISRLHSHRLTQRRPLWECHIIEGLENDRFALFIKMHHALVDGVAAMKLLTQSLSTDAETMMPAPWSLAYEPQVKSTVAKSALSGLRVQANALPESLKAFGKLGRSAMGGEDALVLPRQAPHSILNGRVSGQRRFATQQFSLDRIKCLARAAEVTVNDVILAICGGALREFLRESTNLPSRSLTAMVPVSLRRKDASSGGGNAVGSILTGLATNVADPKRRIKQIAADTVRAKAHLNALSPAAASQYCNLFIAPFVLHSATGYRGNARPYFNVTVSNVPGPIEPRYLLGSRLEACYPVSIPTHGQRLNITCTSYAGNVNFGFIACQDSLPHMQRIAVYSADALAALEGAFGLA